MVWTLLVAGVVAAAVAAWRRRARAARQRAILLLCQQAGLRFEAWDQSADTAWLPFPMFGRSPSGTENVVWDRRRGRDLRVFDYWWEEPRGDAGPAPRRRTSCAVVPLASSAPRLRVAPRELADGVRDVLGLPEVRLELEAFNRRFVVECEDERFAIAFLDPRMMEALLALPDGITTLAGDHALLLSANGLLPPERMLRLYEAAVAIHERVPRSLPSLYPPRPLESPHERRWLQGHWSEDLTHGAGA
jgi:hypothetical protein